MGERDVADQRDDPAGRRGGAEALASVPSIPFAPRLERTRGPPSPAGQWDSRSRTGIEAATNTVAPAGSALASARATFGSLSSSPRTSSSAPATAASASRHAASQPGSAAAGRRARADRRGSPSRPRRPGPASRRGGRRATAAPVEAGEPAAQRLRGRQVADADHDLGRCASAKARRPAAGRSGRPRRAAACARQRVREQRIAGGRPPGPGSRARGRHRRARDDHAAARPRRLPRSAPRPRGPA